MDPKGAACLGLKEWYPNDLDISTELDIIAVHGLAANPYWTWAAVEDKGSTSRAKLATHNGGNTTSNSTDPGEVLWLRDLLPQEVPNARILTFGYNSNYLKSAPKRTVDNLATELLWQINESRKSEEMRSRPIIFLCHCFGGIVVKEALIVATIDKRNYGTLRDCIHGVVFLGTPHKGTSLASYGEMMVSIAKAVALGPDGELVSQIRENSRELWKMSSYFGSIYDEFDIFCFYELLPQRFGVIVVNENSAVIDPRRSLGLDTNHSRLNKFRRRDDPNFQKVVRVILEMVERATSDGDRLGDRGSKARAKSHFQPWEQAAELVLAVETLFNGTIDGQYLLQNDHRITQAIMALELCRFRAWAYTVGLMEVQNSRRPLHASLDAPSCQQVCSLLQRLLDTLNGAAVELTDSQSKCCDDVKRLVTDLYSLLPDEDSQASKNQFQVILVKSDEASELLLIEEACKRSHHPDRECLAAMKRLQLLIEKAEEVKTDNEKLFIERSRISFNKEVKSFHHRSMGTITPKDDLASEEKSQILVELKAYEGIWDTEIGNTLFSRVEALTYFLKRASQHPNLRILECIGYCHLEDRQRLGFVFKAPSDTFVDLNQYMKEHKGMPNLGERVELARLLAHTIFEIHTAGWLHKTFTSHRVIFFVSSPPNLHDVSILSPHVVGFQFSRPDNSKEFSEPGSMQAGYWRYHHPDYKNKAMKKYRRVYDYYSLGVVLFEIATWCTLDDFVKKFKLDALSAEQFSTALKEKAQGLLGGLVGARFRDVVLTCLKADFGDVAETAGGREKELMEFNEQVLQPLMACIV